MKTNAIKNETMPRTAHDLLPGDTSTQYNRKDITGSYRTPDGKAQIDFGITYRNGYPEYTSSGHFNGSSGQCLDEILSAYPEDKKVKLFHTRWKLHHLKNAEMFESLVRQEAARFPYVSFYETQAQDFLSRNGLKFRATLSDSKSCPWSEEYKPHFRVTFSRSGERGRLTFDFWGGTATAYDVLACISSDVHCPSTFEDFCSEYGFDEDSRKSFQTFKRASAFSDRLNKFFTAEEIEQLSEIR